MPALLQAARPRQWIKNLFVATPLVFSRDLDNLPQALRALAAVALFCALSSAVYLWNDIVDVEKDRAHPTKRNRPIAAGRLSIRSAKLAATVLGAGGVLAGLLLGLDFALIAAVYLLQNVAYSLKLKQIVYLDVMVIAAGFLLRVLGGAVAIEVFPSPYLLICTGLLACYLGFGKRAHELALAGEKAAEQRSVLSLYDARVLVLMLYVFGVAALAAFVLYTQSAHTIHFFHTSKMVYTTPFAAFGVARFAVLVRRSSADSPTDAMLRDPAFVLNFVIWAAAVCLIIYLRP